MFNFQIDIYINIIIATFLISEKSLKKNYTFWKCHMHIIYFIHPEEIGNIIYSILFQNFKRNFFYWSLLNKNMHFKFIKFLNFAIKIICNIWKLWICIILNNFNKAKVFLLQYGSSKVYASKLKFTLTNNM